MALDIVFTFADGSVDARAGTEPALADELVHRFIANIYRGTATDTCDDGGQPQHSRFRCHPSSPLLTGTGQPAASRHRDGNGSARRLSTRHIRRWVAVSLGVVGEALHRRGSLLVPDVRSRPNYVSVHPDIRSEVCCPLWVAKRIVGFLDVEATEISAFDEADQMLVETLADHISQAVQNARNLQRMQQQRQELAAMLVHDLRSPLTVIQAGTDLIALAAEESELGADSHHARTMLMACDRMKALIDGVLELHELESGEMTVAPDPTDAAQVVSSVQLGMELVATRASVQLCFDAPVALPAVVADPALLTRILENLVNNALRVTPAAGQVTLAVAEAPPSLLSDKLPGVTDRAILISVEDTGMGVPAAHRDRIFDKFATLESSLGGHRRSTGVGLAFCREAVHVQGGAIWVEGAPGGGARFCVLLPAVPAPVG
ncbi:MAG: hypothetical protein DRI90_18910 [Deltaproteobacteria bacterium]|nr:MAG: hypothetical protein DRI90_18910 [Deltaproteobacteria bacterium]